MVFCNKTTSRTYEQGGRVTILILIDGFLQFNKLYDENCEAICHNPYFNRWFSAILYVYMTLTN